MSNTSARIQQSLAKKDSPAPAAKVTVATILNTFLDSSGYGRRLNELLKERTPQFISTLIQLCTASKALAEAATVNPQSVVQAALKAAAFDLPVDPALGMAYVVPFRVKGVASAQMIIGYKGLLNLAYRTGCYSRINVVDIREGELLKFDYISEDFEVKRWPESEREGHKIIGYLAFMRLTSGFEKTIYMSLEEIAAHELQHRKGDDMGKGWKDDFSAMCRKTVLRTMLQRWGMLSIDYKRNASAEAVALAEAIAGGKVDDEYNDGTEPAEPIVDVEATPVNAEA